MNQHRKRDIRTIPKKELTEFLTAHNEKSFRSTQIFQWLWQKGSTSFREMTNLSEELRETLDANFIFKSLNPVDIQKSTDQTIKTCFQLYDNQLVESVLIPSPNTLTACLSTQVGCPLNCKFCATGKMGFKCNLTVGEIFDQIIFLQKQAQESFNQALTNIVFMGMGEPLLNYSNVLSAIEKITSPEGLGISPSRITLSTAGISRQIKQLADDKVRFNLAISLHTADNNKRNHLMPVNHSCNLEMLQEAIIYFHQKTSQRVTIEYVLLKNFNDSLIDAQKLARFCKEFPCKINLMEYNFVENLPFQKSDKENFEKFENFLKSKNIIVNRRHSKGDGIDAACGQLANKTKINLI